MSKTIFVIEETDTAGEFQPSLFHRKSRREAAELLVRMEAEDKRTIPANRSKPRRRIMEYIRREIRS